MDCPELTSRGLLLHTDRDHVQGQSLDSVIVVMCEPCSLVQYMYMECVVHTITRTRRTVKEKAVEKREKEAVCIT